MKRTKNFSSTKGAWWTIIDTTPEKIRRSFAAKQDPLHPSYPNMHSLYCSSIRSKDIWGMTIDALNFIPADLHVSPVSSVSLAVVESKLKTNLTFNELKPCLIVAL